MGEKKFNFFLGWRKKYSLKNFGSQRWLAAVLRVYFFV
jgi:hypothetical protein